MAWHAGAAPDRDTRVMEVLLSILGDGDSSRLHQRLVEREQAAVQVGTSLDQGFDPGLAWIYAVVPPGGDVARTEHIVDEEIARLAHEGPTPAELTKARNQALAGFWRGLQTISGKAQALGTYEVFHGDYRKLFDAPAGVRERHGGRRASARRAGAAAGEPHGGHPRAQAAGARRRAGRRGRSKMKSTMLRALGLDRRLSRCSARRCSPSPQAA